MNPKFRIGFCHLLAITCSLFFADCLLSQQLADKNEKPASFERPFLIEFEGPIDETLSRHLHSKVEIAKQRNADLLIIEINSPGGLKSESLRIANTLRNIDWAYTVAFIPEQAISGGALVSLGCDEIVVGQEMRFGDIGEIYWDPESFAFRYAPEKLNSTLVPQARTIAKAKGRPPELAEAMIDKDSQVFRRKLGNIWEYQNVRVGEPDPKGDWELIKESEEGRFLTLEGPRMLELGMATATCDTREECANNFKADPDAITVLSYTTTDYVADTLCLPWVTALLIIVGLLALYLELCAPGIGVGGGVAVLCGALFFWSRFFAGTADMLELILFLSGLAFLMLELFVIPGWGIAGFMALLLMCVSAILAGQDFVVPSNNREWATFISQILVLISSGLVVMIGAVFITRRLGSLPIFNRLVLKPVIDESTNQPAKDSAGKPAQTPHPIVSVGDWGHSESLLRPAGRALFAGRSIDVVSDGAFIEPGQPIKVVEIRGNRVVVIPVES